MKKRRVKNLFFAVISGVALNLIYIPSPSAMEWNPIVPGTPIKPGTPIQPGKIIQPGDKIQPGTPITPGDPIEPGNPITPGAPITPGDPIEPGEGIQPGDPIQPGKEIEPGERIQPGDGIRPGDPITPGDPIDPGGESNPGEIAPGAPAEPGGGNRPIHPTAPDLGTDSVSEKEQIEEEKCLPAPGEDNSGLKGIGKTDTGGYANPPSKKSIDDMVTHASDLIIDVYRDHPALLILTGPDKVKSEVEQFREELRDHLENMTERPYGTIDDVNISENEAAILSDYAYDEEKLKNQKKLKKYQQDLDARGWEEVDQVDDDSGFQGKVVINKERGTVAIVFRGTEPDREMAEDFLADAEIATGREVGQFDAARKLVYQVLKKYPDMQPVLVGHSLGGGIAQRMAVENKIPAMTWNAPGIGTRDHSVSFGDVLNMHPLVAMQNIVHGWKDAFSKFVSGPVKTTIKNRNMPGLMNYYNYMGGYDNLITNHIMEGDEIGDFNIHYGKTLMYSEHGTAHETYDYSDEAKARDEPSEKLKNFIDYLDDGLKPHGMDNFFDNMKLC